MSVKPSRTVFVKIVCCFFVTLVPKNGMAINLSFDAFKQCIKALVPQRNSKNLVPDLELRRFERISLGYVKNMAELKIWFQIYNIEKSEKREISYDEFLELNELAPSFVESINVPYSTSSATKFGDFTRHDRKFRYSEMPESAKKTDYLLFRGHGGVDSLKRAEKHIKKSFKKGLKKRGGTHRDVGAHKLDEGDIDAFDENYNYNGNSQFLGTTSWFPIAGLHGTKVNREAAALEGRNQGKGESYGFLDIGVVFIIDPAGVEVLDTEEVPFRIARSDEGEVLFSKRIPPQSIKGALVYNIFGLLKLYLNEYEATE